MQLSRTSRSAKSKLLISPVFLHCRSVPAARADDASHRAKVEEMLRLTKTDSGLHEQLTNLQTRVGEIAKQQFNLPTPTAEQTASITEYEGKMQQITTEEVGWEQLRPVIVTSSTPTALPMRIWTASSRSTSRPAGRRWWQKMPQVAGKTTATVQDRIKELQPKLAIPDAELCREAEADAARGSRSVRPSAPSTDTHPRLQPGRNVSCVLTLALDDVSQHRFDIERRRHFPPALNRIPAHLTLFHTLPEDDGYDSTRSLAAHIHDQNLPMHVSERAIHRPRCHVHGGIARSAGAASHPCEPFFDDRCFRRRTGRAFARMSWLRTRSHQRSRRRRSTCCRQSLRRGRDRAWALTCGAIKGGPWEHMQRFAFVNS